MTHAVITGAAGGIGRAIATELVKAGHTVVTLVDRNADDLAVVVEDCKALGATDVFTYAADLGLPETPAKLIEDVWAHAPIDVLVNSAGMYPATPFFTLTAETWDRVQAINTRAPFFLSLELGRKAIEAGTKPNVITISSGAANRARPGSAPYSTSKAAVEGAMRAAAIELAEYGIRVNTVAPGFVGVASKANPISEEYASIVGQNPLGRPGTGEDIAGAVVYLASEAASWVTGSVISVNGGAGAGTNKLPLHWDSNNLGAVD